MRYAQLAGNTVRWIFEADRRPDWPADSAGNHIQIEDISLLPEVEEGWTFENGVFSCPVVGTDPPEAVGEVLRQATLNELAENQLIIMQALADLYEGGLTTNG